MTLEKRSVRSRQFSIRVTAIAALAVLLISAASCDQPPQPTTQPTQSSQVPAAMTEVRFMTLDPGHFHAGLVQKEMYQGASRIVHVYAPLGADLTEHLNRIAGFNTRKENPTSWELEIHACPDF